MAEWEEKKILVKMSGNIFYIQNQKTLKYEDDF